MSTVGDRIEQARQSRGISRRELDRRAGLAEGHVSIIVNRYRRNPNTATEMPTLEAIAKGLQVSKRWLAFGQGGPDNDDGGLPLSTADSDSPTEGSLPGWDDAVRVARAIDPELDPTAIERASKAARLLTTAPASAELVIQLARAAMRFAGPDQLAEMRAAAEARTQRIREAYDAHYETGAPLPDDVPRDEVTAAGQKAIREGKIKLGPPPTYRGGTEQGSEGA